MNQAEMPAWAKDMQDCRRTTLKIMKGIRNAIEDPKNTTISTPVLGEDESLSDALIKMGSFLLRWHAFERGLEDAAFLGDAEGDRPLAQEDEVIMREYLRNAKS